MPQSSVPPQPSPTVPQVIPRDAHVRGTQPSGPDPPSPQSEEQSQVTMQAVEQLGLQEEHDMVMTQLEQQLEQHEACASLQAASPASARRLAWHVVAAGARLQPTSRVPTRATSAPKTGLARLTTAPFYETSPRRASPGKRTPAPTSAMPVS